MVSLAQYIKKYRGFFYSILFGLTIWLIAYALTPVTAIEELKAETFLFISACFLSLILGFVSFKFSVSSNTFKAKSINFYFNSLLLIIFLSFLFRWVDLFVYRELSFTYSPRQNRLINDVNINNSNLFFVILSIIKGAYFFPFVLARKLKFKTLNWQSIASSVLLLLPLLEAFLKGTRKPFFEVFLIVIITLLICNKNQFRVRNVVVLFCFTFLLMSISLFIVTDRDKDILEADMDFFSNFLDSRYNELLRPNENIKAFLTTKNNNEFIRYYAFIGLQTGQYISHGVFEFNHIINDKDLPITKGKYTFSTIPKFINKIKLGKEIDIINPSPRQYVYLTAYGGLFIDFRWFAPIFIFIFGVFQKYVYQKSKAFIFYTPLLIYLLLINVFLFIINYISGSGIYPIVAFVILFSIFKLYEVLRREVTSHK